jgi:hypothetical protein
MDIEEVAGVARRDRPSVERKNYPFSIVATSGAK